MKIVIAPDSYKESLAASEVANAIEVGFRQIFPEAEYIKVPVADGGEGTVDAMISATDGKKIFTEVTDPLGQRVNAYWGLSGDGKTAFIEMAQASGLGLVAPDARNPLITTSWGTGELIRAALDYGARHLIIGIGGSATNDAGAGMLQALGAQLGDKEGNAIGYGGAALADLATLSVEKLDARLKQARIQVACDVTNPLTGPNGASYVFGPQKGATAEMQATLDANLAHFAKVVHDTLGIQVAHLPGAGAAGGMGAALVALLGAELRRGIELVTDALELDKHIRDCTLVITGEGRIDSQSINGKVPVGVAVIAQKYNKPVIGIAGSLTPDVGIVHDYGIDAVFSVVNRIMTLDDALQNAWENIVATSRNIAATLAIGRSI